MGDYFKERNLNNIKRLRRVLAELPPFCTDFMVGIENTSSPLTRLNYAHDLRIFFDYLIAETPDFPFDSIRAFDIDSLKKVTGFHLEKFLSYLSLYTFNGKRLSNGESAKSRKLSSVRNLFKYLYRKGILEENITEKVELPKKHDKEILRLEINEIVRLLDEVEAGSKLSEGQLRFHKKNRLRDLAILTVFLGTGIRISELVGLNLSDLNFDSNAFTVTRKGGNRAVLYFHDEVESALKDYLAQRKINLSQLADFESIPLFLSIQNNRISTKAVQMLVKKYCKNVTPGKKITPHKLRSTFGTNLYRETNDIYVVADVLGHRDVNTTKKHYAAISDDIRRNAARHVKLRDDKAPPLDD